MEKKAHTLKANVVWRSKMVGEMVKKKCPSILTYLTKEDRYEDIHFSDLEQDE